MDTITKPEPQTRKRNQEALDFLLSRQSGIIMQEPAPNDDELDVIFDVGLRAPDHAMLRPWRFVIIRGDARSAYADLLVEAQRQREGQMTDEMAERLRGKIVKVPLIIAVGAKIKTDCPIPEIEQLLSAGAATMNMLNAIHASGYAAKWVTGGGAYDRTVNEALGFTFPDRLVGLLFVGSPPAVVRPTARPARADFVREWHGK
jgi:nitroreductase